MGGRETEPPTAFGELCKILLVKISEEQVDRKMGEPSLFQVKTQEADHQLAGRLREKTPMGF